MFNIALSARMADWTPDDMIGDILYALVSLLLFIVKLSYLKKLLGFKTAK